MTVMLVLSIVSQRERGHPKPISMSAFKIGSTIPIAGQMLKLDLNHNWDTEAQKMLDHVTQMASVTQSSIRDLDATSTRCGETCSAGDVRSTATALYCCFET